MLITFHSITVFTVFLVNRLLSKTLWNFINPKLLKIYTVMQKSHTFMVLSASFLRLQSQFIVIELLGKLIMVIAGII